MNVLDAISKSLYEVIDAKFGAGRARGSCVLCSLIVRDVLENNGIDAHVEPVISTCSISKTDCRTYVIGDPDMQKVPGRWAGHLVVISDEYLIDPTIGAMKRDYLPVDWPDMWVVAITEADYENQPFISQNLMTERNYPGSDRAILYYRCAENTAWKNGPDARKLRRNPLAKKLSFLVTKQLKINSAEETAVS